MIQVFIADISNLDINSDYGNISQYRLKKIEKYISDHDKALSLGVELLLNYGIQKLFPDFKFPLEVKTKQYGKPYIENAPFFFNLAHSHNIAVCAISDKIVGVDVEQIGEADLKIAKRFFHVSEYNTLINAEKSDRANIFYTLWTLKESYIKAIGKGLSIPLNEFLFDFKKPASIWLGNEAVPYKFCSYDNIPGYKLALCYESDCGEDIVFETVKL